MLHSRGRSFILDWISVWSLEDHSTRYGCKLWRVPWTMFWSSCAGGRSCWGTRRLNCGYEDLVISSSTQPTCCTAQRTMSEVSCIDATRSPFSPVITPLALTNKGLIECRRKKKQTLVVQCEAVLPWMLWTHPSLVFIWPTHFRFSPVIKVEEARANLVREFRQLLQVILLDYEADWAKL